MSLERSDRQCFAFMSLHVVMLPSSLESGMAVPLAFVSGTGRELAQFQSEVLRSLLWVCFGELVKIFAVENPHLVMVSSSDPRQTHSVYKKSPVVVGSL